MKKIKEANNPNYDLRQDLGRGISSDKFHKQRMSQGTFPYKEPTQNFEEQDNDLSIAQKVINKISGNYIASDSYMSKGGGRYAMVDGSTNFSEGYYASGKSLSPISNLYKNRDGVMGQGPSGASIRPGPAQTSLSGTKVGWSQASNLKDAGSESNIWHIQDIPTEDERTIFRLKRTIKAIHDQDKKNNEFK